MNTITFTSLLLLLAVAFATDDEPKAHTTSGTLIGKLRTELNIKEFLGVPYGTPPLGQLRFQPPLPLADKEKDKILITKKFAPICIQPDHIKSALNPLLHFNKTTMSEDCLYLNLYIPNNREGRPLPVMVFLVGEGFNYADPSQIDGGFLAVNGKVIVVTLSYRVSVFGFLNVLSTEAPGNAGLWDQRLALKWIQKNIAAFGGNPNKVTLCGRFTGAMSAAIHAFSRISQNETLFHRVILHSGVPDGKWIFDSTPLNSVTDLAELVDCVFDNFNTTISCLKNIPADKLLKSSISVQNAWRPSLDFTLIDEMDVSKLIKGGYSPVDVLTFTNANEGSLCLTALKVFNKQLYDKIVTGGLTRQEFNQLVSSFVLDVLKDNNSAINDLVSFMYTRKPYNLDKKFVEFCGDLYITAPTGKLSQALAERKRNIYVAELNHRPSFSNQPAIIEAGHGDAVVYSLGLPLQLQNLPEEESRLTRRILKAMSNFAYYGNPNALNETTWPVYSSDTKLVMSFDTHSDSGDIAKTTHENAVMFWGTITPDLLKKNCPQEHVSAALTDAEENNRVPPHVTILGTWVSVPAAQYIIGGLICACALLLVSIVLALVVMYRQTSSMSFHRLK